MHLWKKKQWNWFQERKGGYLERVTAGMGLMGYIACIVGKTCWNLFVQQIYTIKSEKKRIKWGSFHLSLFNISLLVPGKEKTQGKKSMLNVCI
jgi:hypothetical protein